MARNGPTSWAGWRSWFSIRPLPPISRWSDNAAAPWVNTNSSQRPPRQLTSGSNLNQAAEGPWRPIIDAGLIDFAAGNANWRPSFLRTVNTVNQPANYGGVTSRSNFSFRNNAFPSNDAGPTVFDNGPNVALLPGPIPNPYRPMWNNLPGTNVYNMRVNNPTKTRLSELVSTNPNSFSLSGSPYNSSASLNTSGTFKTEVLV